MSNLKSVGNYAVKVLLSVLLGGAILYWMYRGFDFSQMERAMRDDMDWTWMLLSLPFGILAQMFRGWRWHLSLDPIGEHARHSTSVNAVFLSYAVSLLIPRMGEVVRCAVLKRWDKVSFSKTIGTVVTERVIDSLLVMLITVAVFLCQIPVFMTFFDKTGTSFDNIISKFTTEGWIVTAVCALTVIGLLVYLLRRLSVYEKVKATFLGVWEGVTSLKKVSHPWLFVFYTVGIWLSYFLHYYLTFFCFKETSTLGIMSVLVTFIVGSIAVIVPTPNGAGPWHFAVKTMLILYGISSSVALNFVLIVHTVQTLLVVLLGLWAWAALSMTSKKTEPVRKD